MSRLHHKHFTPVAPLPGEPDLFQNVGFGVQVTFPPEPPSLSIDTSREAAARIRPHTACVREAIYLYIRACGGATAGEIATGCGLNPSTVRPRLLELQGLAKWAPGLPARIQRSPEVRNRMHIYVLKG